MKQLFFILAGIFLIQSAQAKKVSPVVINDGRSVYAILSKQPKLRAQITNRGLAFKFSPVVEKIIVSFSSVTEDPEWLACAITYKVKVGQLVPFIQLGGATSTNIAVEPPFMAGLVDASVTEINPGDCQQIKEDEFSE